MTSFQCPSCHDYTLHISASVDVAPKNPMSSEETVQTIACSACDFKGLALYLESHNDHVNHDGYELDLSSFEHLDTLLKKTLGGDTSAKQELQTMHNLSFADTPVKVQWRSIFPLHLKP